MCSSDLPPYPDVNAVLNMLLADVQTVLGEHFIGMYLYGSLSSGDFDPERSDIDFVVVTDELLPDETIAALRVMYARILDSGLKWAAKLEGVFVPRYIIRRHDPNHPRCTGINEGQFGAGRLQSDWVIQRHIIREQGVILAGPDPHTLIDPVGPDDLRGAVRAGLYEWWKPMLDDPSWLRDVEYQAFAVLTMCRALYTLEHGAIASKPVSARWALETLGEPWAALISRALAWSRDSHWDYLDETLDFMRYTIERSKQDGD